MATYLLDALPSTREVYIADYCYDLSRCKGETLGNGMYRPATKTYSAVLSLRRSWSPPATVLSQLGAHAPPPHIPLWVPQHTLGCACGKPSELTCSHDNCRQQLCTSCFDVSWQMGRCDECHEVTCNGHSAICIICRIRVCVDRPCLQRIATYCESCYQPMCRDCALSELCPMCVGSSEYDDDEEEEEEDGVEEVPSS